MDGTIYDQWWDLEMTEMGFMMVLWSFAFFEDILVISCVTSLSVSDSRQFPCLHNSEFWIMFTQYFSINNILCIYFIVEMLNLDLSSHFFLCFIWRN
jgi:hypothetical protein